jgi:hypothetical protein
VATEKAHILGLFLGFWIGLKIFLPLKRNREFCFEPKIQYARAAERSEAASSDLQFPFWCVCLTKSEPFLNGTDGALRAPN